MSAVVGLDPVRAGATETTTRSRVGANARKREATRTALRAEARRHVAGRFARVAPRFGLVLALAASCGAGFLGVRHFADVGGWIALREIEVTGFARVPPAEIASLSGAYVGASLTEIDLEAVRSRLAAHPWIARVSVRRSFPHRLRIVVRERVPALGLPDGRWASTDGRVMEARGGADPVMVAGLVEDGAWLGSRALPVAVAMDEIARRAPALRARLREAAMEKDGSLSVRLEGFAPLLRVRPEDWKRGFARAGVLEKELETEAGAIVEIDLRHGSCAALRRGEGGV